MSNTKKMLLRIEGMTCGSCEVLLERKFKKIPGVTYVKIHHASGKAFIHYDQKPELKAFEEALLGTKYRLVDESEISAKKVHPKNTFQDYLEIISVSGVLFGIYLLLKSFHILDSGLGITTDMSYGFIFLVGLVAASSSCIAVAGGVLISVAARYNERYQSQTALEKLKPHLLFNIGRIVSYTVLGGLLGVAGSFFQLSSGVTGFITILASLFMILTGIKILRFFPSLHKFSLMMPKWISHKVLDLETKEGKHIPLLMGGLTFFLPCGFTQALQLYAISRGSFVDGALTMLFFSLGTLPALLSLSAISSFSKGLFQRYFLKFAGVMVLALGVANIGSGLTLMGVSLPSWNNQNLTQADVNSTIPVPIVDGKQIMTMKVDGYNYLPSQFTVVEGIPVEWRIDGTKAAGCGQVLDVPSLGMRELMPRQGIKTIAFTPNQTGDIPFNCSMGMMTPGAVIHVIPNSSQP